MCGIVGISVLKGKHGNNQELGINSNMGKVIFELLEGNKNRGQEGYGIATYNGVEIHTSKFKKIYDKDTISRIEEQKSEITSIIGHARYPTSGNNKGKNALQPFNHKETLVGKGFSFAFNGNIANTGELSESLEKFGYELKMNGLDTEVLKFLIIKEIDSGNTELKTILENVLRQIDGACNIAIIKDNGELAIAKDRNGLHPLSWSEKDGLFLFSSEDGALYGTGCNKINYVKAGEMIKVENGNISIEQLDLETNNTPCVFELIYFSSPESTIHGTPVSHIRANLGRQLALEMGESIEKENSITVDVPSSSHYQTKGFAQKSRIKNINGITKNPNIDRSFIVNADSIEEIIKHKYIFNPNMKEYIEGKVVYLTDDSVVRGKTMKYLVKAFKEFYNPKEVHLAIPSPAVMAPCFYGINMPSIEELIIPEYIKDPRNPEKQELDNMAKYLGADSINYLSISGLSNVLGDDVKVTNGEVKGACMACLTGIYPTTKGQDTYDGQVIKFNKKN